MWVLGLACKAMLNILKAGLKKDELLKIIQSGVVSFLVNLASQGTGFSKQWLLRDLEVCLFLLIRLIIRGCIVNIFVCKGLRMEKPFMNNYHLFSSGLGKILPFLLVCTLVHMITSTNALSLI